MKQLLLLGILLAGCQQSAPPPVAEAAPPTPTPAAAAPADAGKSLFTGTCSACHGQEAQGLPGLGKPLKGSAMFKLSDDELVAFIKKGRAPGEKDNTTGVAMPPKGGNPALTDDQLKSIVGYLRSIQ